MMEGYVAVAKRGELRPSAIKPLRYAGRRYILLEHGGKVYCYDGVCPRDGGPLEFGQLSGKYLYCPFDHSVFDVTSGKPLPGSPCDKPLTPHQVLVEGDTVYARLEV